MVKVLVSACLIGHNTKYDGKNNLKEEVTKLTSFCKLIPICPEVDGGLPTPRIPSEIRKNQVINKDGLDVTNEFRLGAKKALDYALKENIKYAILKEKSPSCGVYQVYDGTFTGTKVKGMGITTKLLRENGILVFNEDEVSKLIEIIKEQV